MRGQRACSEAVCQGDGWRSHIGWGGRKRFCHSLSPAWPGGFWYQAYGNSPKAVCVVALAAAAHPWLRKQQRSLVFLCCLTWDFFKARSLMSPSFVTPQHQPRGCFQPGVLPGEEGAASPPAALAHSQVPRAGASIYLRWELPWQVQDEVSLLWDRVGSGGEPGMSLVVAGHRVVARGEVPAMSSSRGNPGGYGEGCSG